VTLTGILSMGLLPSKGAHPSQGRRSRPFGQTLTADGLYGPDHQHLFCVRMDMAVDGVDNRVVEVEVEPTGTSTDDDEDEYARRHGRLNAFRRKATVLKSEASAAREANPRRGRHWLIESTTKCNGLGEPTAWRLEPGVGASVVPACSPGANYLDRAAFVSKCLWATRYHPNERYPAGDFPNQRPPSQPDGLPVWTAKRDASLEGGCDLVLWHTFGVTHVVRPEDAPVMPCERASFHLKPHGFFDASPCVDVPCSACGPPPRSRL